MLEQLMWKDFQNQKGILLLGVFFLIAPYVIWFFGDGTMQVLATCALLSLFASQLTVVVLGATIIGLERQNLGLDFLLGLPVSRSKVLVSKALISLFFAGVIWGVFLVVSEVFTDAESLLFLRPFGAVLAAVGFLLFSTAWLMSILYRGTALAIGVAMTVATTVIVSALYYAAGQAWPLEDYGTNLQLILIPLCIVLGVIEFAYGWIVFVRRCEP